MYLLLGKLSWYIEFRWRIHRCINSIHTLWQTIHTWSRSEWIRIIFLYKSNIFNKKISYYYLNPFVYLSSYVKFDLLSKNKSINIFFLLVVFFCESFKCINRFIYFVCLFFCYIKKKKTDCTRLWVISMNGKTKKYN